MRSMVVAMPAGTAFPGSFTVLPREGLEGMMIEIGMLAFPRKAAPPHFRLRA